ncbi:putative HNH homing endonuclease [uncultured Caudovirales phage]|uniref:Putative HNH homing endonuclease n=1 Tax=uncultured Caudovirales phage TaxID=2100421 RepID=A0A2H4J8G9_9CAUD|nr:putative HNH homing endonuclease [uncultured Caudovirales phage]
MLEQWKDIDGYEGIYQISDHGRVKNRNGLIMAARINKGYLMVNLNKHRKCKTYAIHRLVAKHFIKNPLGKREVNHLDENKLNNNVDNLQWATSKENANWGTRNIRISEYVKRNPITILHRQGYDKRKKAVIQLDPITEEIVSRYESTIAASIAVGCNNGKISECCNGKRKSTRGYLWRFAS